MEEIGLKFMRFQFTRNKLPQRKNKKAFALVLALALMGFMVLLIVTLAAIVQMQVRLTNQSIIDAKARQAAKFAAYQALNEIQVNLGPDRRITANASMFEDQVDSMAKAEKDAQNKYEWWEYPLEITRDDINNLKGNKIKNNYWLGVWDSTPGNESKGSKYNIKPGSYESRDDYRERVINDAQGWLVSGNKQIKNASERFKYKPTDTLEENDSIVAVSAASAADESGESSFEAEKRGVSIPVVSITENMDIVSGQKESTPYETRIAWWVSDEGQKASINAIASEEMFNIAENEDFYMQSLPYYSGIHSLRLPIAGSDALSLRFNEDSRQIIRALDSVGDLDFVKSSEVSDTMSLGKVFFHDITSNTKGVLVNVREGGLKKDLSLGLIQVDRENDTWTTNPKDVSASARSSLYVEYFARPFGQSGYNYKSSAYSTLPKSTDTITSSKPDVLKFNTETSIASNNIWKRATGHIFGPQLPINAKPNRRDASTVDTYSKLAIGDMPKIWSDESFVKDPGGPLWDQLRSYYNLRVETSKNSSGQKIRTRLQTDDRYGFYPVLQRFQVFFIPVLVGYGNNNYGIRLHIVPVAVLWNPYDVKIEGGNYYMVHMETTSSNYMAFRMAIGVVDGSYFQCIRDLRTEKMPTDKVKFKSSSYPIGYGGVASSALRVTAPGSSAAKKRYIQPVPLYLNDIYIPFGYNPDPSCNTGKNYVSSPYNDTQTNGTQNNYADLRFVIYDNVGIDAGEAKVFMVKKQVSYFRSFYYMYSKDKVADTYLVPFSGSPADYGSLYIDVPHAESAFAAKEYYSGGLSYDNLNCYVLFKADDLTQFDTNFNGKDINDLYVDIQNCNAAIANPGTNIIGYGYVDRTSSKESSNNANFYRCNLHMWNLGQTQPFDPAIWGDGVDPRWLKNDNYVRGPVLAYFKGNRDQSYYPTDYYNKTDDIDGPSFPDSRCWMRSNATRYKIYDSKYGNPEADFKPGTHPRSDGTFTKLNFLEGTNGVEVATVDSVINPRRHSPNRWLAGNPENGGMDGVPSALPLSYVNFNITSSDTTTSTEVTSSYSTQLYNAMSVDDVNLYGIVFLTPTAYNADSSKPVFNRKFLLNNAIMGMGHDFDYSPRAVNMGVYNSSLPSYSATNPESTLYQTYAQRTKGMYGQNQAFGVGSTTTPAFFKIPPNNKPNIGLDGKNGNNQAGQLIHILRDKEVITNPANLSAAHLNFGPGQVRLYNDKSTTAAATEFYKSYGIQSLDYLNPTYAIGNSTAPLRGVPERSFRISWVDGPPQTQDGAMWVTESDDKNNTLYNGKLGSVSEERAVLYDASYHLNDALWDEYFFSTLPYRNTEIGDKFSALESENVIPRNPRLVYYAGADKLKLQDLSSHVSAATGQLGETGFDSNAGALMLNGPFNVNSTSIDAWKTVLSTHFQDTVYSYASGGTKNFTKKTPFVRWEAPYNNKPLEDSSYVEDDLLKGYRVLSEDEIEELAVSIVENIKDRGPFYSMSDFVNRVVENRPTEVIYDSNQRLAKNESYMNDEIEIAPRTDKSDSDFFPYKQIHMQKGVLQAAIDYTGINSQFHSSRSRNFIISSDGKDSPYNGNITDLLSANDIGRKYFENPRDSWENWRSAIGPQAQGIPEYLMQQDILAKLGSFMTVRSDTFKIRAYGEIRNPVTQAVEGKAWCEMTVQRVPEYVDRTDEAWKFTDREGEIGPNNTNIDGLDLDDFIKGTDDRPENISKTNRNLGRRFKVVSFRWLNKNEI